MADDVVARVELDEGARFIGRDASDRDGLELLLMSLAVCTAQTALPVLRKMRQDVTGCLIVARGERREQHPTVLTRIHLDITVRGHGLDAEAVRYGVTLAETGYCPVWAMLSPGIPITGTVAIAEGA